MDALVRPGSCGEWSESSVFNILNDMSFPALPLSHVIVHCRSITGAAPGAAPHMQVLLGKHRGSTVITGSSQGHHRVITGASGVHHGASQGHHRGISGHHRGIPEASRGHPRGIPGASQRHHGGITGASQGHPRGITGASQGASQGNTRASWRYPRAS